VQSSSQIITTNKPTPSFLQAGCPFCRPTNSVKALKGKYHISYGFAYPKLTWGLPTLSLTTNSSWLPWGGLPCLSWPWLENGTIITFCLRNFTRLLWLLWITSSISQVASCSVWFQWPWVTLKGGTRGVKFFWHISIIMLVRFDLELPNLAR